MPKIHPSNTGHKRKAIPKAMREQIWLRDFGKAFEAKCKTSWCQNKINVWDFHAGHNIPDSKGGATEPANLVPICNRCNLSMSNNYSFDEWSAQQRDWPSPINPVPVAPPPSWCC
jgi:5-methylcytosine-specific restriction endonuclease McrA